MNKFKALGYSALCSTALVSQAQKQPNVLVIMADDLGYEDLGFQGSPKVKTPNIDAIARSGIIFSDAHTTASVCAPSRAGFMIGRYPQRAGFEANQPPTGKGLDPSEYTFADGMKSLGYKTYVCGKWHVGRGSKMHPMSRGFDEYCGNGALSHEFKGAKGFFPKEMELNKEKIKVSGHKTDILTDQALKMLNKDKDKPFFMFLSYFAPHTPLQAPKEEVKKAAGNVYHAMIQNMDKNIGRVIAKLKEDGRYENTMIWFLSDNGGTCKQMSNKPLNGKKGIKLEGGQRVPFVLSWPKKIKPGQRFDGITSSMDIFATSFKAGGGKTTPKPLDGVDIMPYITDKKTGNPHDILLWRKLEGAAVRMGNWKLIRTAGLPLMLYNLEDDLGETSNLAKSNPEKAQALLKRLESWEKELKSPLWKEGKKFVGMRKSHYLKYTKMKK